MALVVDITYLDARGQFTLLAILVGVPMIAYGWYKANLYFAHRLCPRCGIAINEGIFQCPSCGERFLGNP